MFNEDLNHKLEMFDGLHLGTLLLFLIIIVLFYIFREKIKNPRFEKVFRISLGSFLLVFEASYHIWVLSRDYYGLDMIPLTGFCALTNLFTALSLLTGKHKYFNYLIYYALTGALLSLVFIDTEYVFPHFRYFHYFFVHFGFLLASLYYYFINKIEFTKKNIHRASSSLFAYSMVVLIFDIILEKNWFYMLQNPVKEISDGLGAPWYTILWVLSITVVTYLWYLLLGWFKRVKINRERKNI